MIEPLRDVLNNRIKTAYIASYITLVVFAYILIVKIDGGRLRSLNRTALEAGQNLRTLQMLAQYRTYIAQFNSHFAADKGASSLIETVTDAARKESITLSLIRPVEGGIKSGYRKIGVLAEGRAPYYNIVRFLADLENRETFIAIEEFNLSSEAGEGARNAVFKLTAACLGAEQ